MDLRKTHFLLLSCLLLTTFISTSTSANTKKPHALLFPVKKDPATLLYVTRLKMRSPSSLLSYVVDLGQRFLWLNCESKLPPSSTVHQVLCTEPDCKLIQTAFSCADNKSSCGVVLDNPFHLSSVGELTTDLAAFVSTDGSNPGPEVVDKQFIFACASSNVMKGLPTGAVGIAGFGRNRVGMPVQLAVEYGLQPKFALCLTGGRSDGVIFVGDGPYMFLPAVDATPVLYTPLIVNRVSTAGALICPILSSIISVLYQLLESAPERNILQKLLQSSSDFKQEIHCCAIKFSKLLPSVYFLRSLHMAENQDRLEFYIELCQCFLHFFHFSDSLEFHMQWCMHKDLIYLMQCNFSRANDIC